MKNIIYLFLIILLMFSGCSFNSLQNSSSKLSDIPDNLEIICFDKNNIIYGISDNLQNNNIDITLFSLDLTNKKTSKISKMEDIQGIIDTPVLLNENLIIPIKKSDYQYLLLKIDLNNNSSEVIMNRKSITHLTDLLSFKNELIFFTVNTANETTINLDNVINEYNVDLINISNKKINRFFSEKYNRSNEKGNIITAVAADDTFIYCFQDSSNEIIQYNASGEEIKRYSLDIKSFLEPSFLKELDLTDFIFQLKKSDQYFILSTLNQRKLIYKIDNSGLLPVSLPEELSAEFPNYRIGEINNGKFDNIYFINQSRGDKTVIIFESKAGKFKYLDIPLKENVMRTIYMNSEGDLLIQEYFFDEHGNQKSELIFIKNENLNFYE